MTYPLLNYWTTVPLMVLYDILTWVLAGGAFVVALIVTALVVRDLWRDDDR